MKVNDLRFLGRHTGTLVLWSSLPSSWPYGVPFGLFMFNGNVRELYLPSPINPYFNTIKCDYFSI